MDPLALCATFDEDAATYDRWRPRYVPELFAAVFQYAGPPGKALKMGLGTGQATEPFLQAGWQVTGVERGERLAAFAREKFRHQPQLQVVQGDFLTCPLEGPFDLFYAATAFHWLPEDRAFPRVKELLRPGGAVALFWNHPQPERPGTPAFAAIQAVYKAHQSQEKKTHRGISQQSREEKEALLRRWGFTQVESHQFHGVRQLSPEGYVGLMHTYSDFRAMEASAQEALSRDMAQAICRLGGTVHVYDTMELYLARRP